MARRRHPADEPAVSEAQRAEWLAQREMGRPIGLEPGPPSRSRIGKLFDFIERLIGGAQGRPWH